jgi:hypothetical protein
LRALATDAQRQSTQSLHHIYQEVSMLKKLMITTAVSALMVGSAAAQATSPSPQKPPSPPPAAAPAQKAPEAQKPTAQQAPAAKSQDKPQEMTQPAPGAQQAQPTIVGAQQPDQLLFSKFNGTDVIGGDNEKVGDVSDVLFSKDGKIEAYIVRIGGFLGIGAKDVALAPSAFEVVPGDKSKNESDKLKVAMTREQLKDASTFKPHEEPRATTGMGGGTPPRTGTGAGGVR